VAAIEVDVADDIATVTLDRPPVNAVDTPTLEAIAAAFSGLAERRDGCGSSSA
jgi:enoyl-CoA hydratase